MRDYEIINENLSHALAAFSYVRPSGIVHIAPGLSLVSAGVPYSLFNTAHLTEHLPGDCGSLSDVLGTAGEFFASLQLPWSIWFCESFLSARERRTSRLLLATAGLKMMMDTPGMIAEELAPPRRMLPRMIFHRVGDERTRRDFASIMSLSFLVPPVMAAEVYGSELIWTGPFTGWLGYVADAPVATACTVVGGGSVGLYAVGTHPDHQRQGYGEVMVRHALAVAREESGITRSVLQSSAAGYSLYVALGFRNVTRFSVFVK